MPVERCQYPGRAGLSAAVDHGDRVLAHVYGDRYADLLAGQPALPRNAVPKMQVGVVHVGLVNPDQVAQDDAVLMAVDGGHHAVAPLPCRLVGYAQLLGHGVEGHVEPHEADEAAPGRHVGFGPFQHRAGERGEPGPAGAAAPALDPSGGPPVPEGRGRAAGGAGGGGTVEVGGLGEGAEAVLLAAAPLADGPAEELEVPPRRAPRRRPRRRCVGSSGCSRPQRGPPAGIVAKQEPGGLRCKFSFGGNRIARHTRRTMLAPAPSPVS